MGIIEPLSVRLRMLNQIHENLKQHDRCAVSAHIARQLFNYEAKSFFYPDGIDELKEFYRNFGYKYEYKPEVDEIVFSHDELAKDGLKSERYLKGEDSL